MKASSRQNYCCCSEGLNFTTYMIESNNLGRRSFYRWAFYPGMLFHSNDKWWGDWGTRDKTHEGVDFCIYEAKNGEIISLGAMAAIPVLYDGTVVKIVEDYIGKSIFVYHPILNNLGRQLCSIYGHVIPHRDIEIRSSVKAGYSIAAICDADKRGAKMESHLHLSIAWIPRSLDYRKLDWNFLTDCNDITLVDPLEFTATRYTILTPMDFGGEKI